MYALSKYGFDQITKDTHQSVKPLEILLENECIFERSAKPADGTDLNLLPNMFCQAAFTASSQSQNYRLR